MTSVLRNHNWLHCIVYLDDVLIFGKNNIEQHLINLREILKILSNAGIKLSPQKCNFLSREVQFLGHIVSKDGLKTSPDKIEKIINR